MPMSPDVKLLDDATRPKARKIEGVSEAQRRHGQRLALFHAAHLRELAHIRHMLDLVAEGRARAADLGAAVSNLQMLENYRRFGALCGQGCMMLTFHHTIEDQHIFPLLEHAAPEVRAVVERLRAEHEVIHALLEDLERAARAAIAAPGPESFDRLREVYDTLEPVVASHFGYEQAELEEALGYYGVPI
ncbi:MAG: hemerythrin domain-containing protein [Azospirillaceae bacterium]